ncbi:chondroitin AC/alginate lyase [Cantharellus anzutake]|uniref:chondroitin AC/alginate lyase n=1 Tax=Cantharellus anzutake TaxID=1750568 RepID=UPI0019050F8E|nr:chondroitin AC/alginate lyase [Cantharellus anzutake]KAF8341531.1 chondroitin AC/alginate lyase [Cantharellus anzutake]
MPSWRVFLVLWVVLVAVLSITARGSFYDSRRHHRRILGGIILSNSTNTLVSTATSTITQTSPTHLLTENITATSTSNVITGPTSVASSSAVPTSTGLSSNLQTVYDRRVEYIIGGLTGLSKVSTWLSTQQPDGRWPDVDYTSGCPARRANWPAQQHWIRINVLAGVYHGSSTFGRTFAKYVKSPDVRTAITRAMDWWFLNDYSNLNCLDNGGGAGCPCGTPGLWNTNWYSNIILIPGLAGQACLLLLQQPPPGNLTQTQYSNCTQFTYRSFNTFTYPVIGGIGALTGANTLDVASIGISYGLLLGNDSVVSSAYERVHEEVKIQTPLMADGIRPDGSFGQHAGVLYTGNYGTFYANDVLGLELQAVGTPWTAGSDSKNAFISFVDGFQWSIYWNILTTVLHWDFSVLGRFISFPVADIQATASIRLNLTQIEQLGKEWHSDGMVDTARRLNRTTTNANAGQLVGNRMFWDNDYMIHRGRNYVATLKMYSTRTLNTECLNDQNPYGFHLSDGVLYTYLQGGEYEDIAAAWDWNLIPGITTDYGNTPLSCDRAQSYGVEDFVGGVSDGIVGVAAMRYTNPLTRSFKFQKAWFFFEEVQHVLVSSVVSLNSSLIRNVLDQKVHNGTEVYVNEQLVSSSGNYSSFSSLWHQDVGYVFQNNSLGDTLNLALQVRRGSWAPLGISTQPDAVVDMFTATIDKAPGVTDLRVSYSIYPGVKYDDFTSHLHSPNGMGGPPLVLRNDATISGVLDRTCETAGVVFWAEGGGSIDIPFWGLTFTLTIDKPSVVVVRPKENEFVVADPSQGLQNATITMSWCASGEDRDAMKRNRTVHINFPQEEGYRGQSVRHSLFGSDS